jgi:dolichol-phosphate mannosyltransferase
MRTLVVLPTYNEKKNIGTLLDSLFQLEVPLDVLVVDDNSPDGTQEVIREKQKQYGENRLKLVVRMQGKAGRGSACLHGFAIAREEGYDAALEMDTDLSHDPKDIPTLLEGLSHADVVVGSKFHSQSHVIGYEWYRKILSYSANFYAGLILRMPIRDYTNGFRCYNAKALALLPTLPITGVGFTVIPQMSYLLHKAGMRLTEVPITFQNRLHGKSNMGLPEITESFFSILYIRSRVLDQHVRQLIKFFVTGLTNLFLDLALLAFFVEIVRLPLVIAAPVTSVIVVTNVFIMNKLWTFKNKEKKVASQGVKFILVYASSIIMVNVLTLAFTEYAGIWYIPSRIVSILLCALWNYSWMHFGVFGAHRGVEKL